MDRLIRPLTVTVWRGCGYENDAAQPLAAYSAHFLMIRARSCVPPGSCSTRSGAEPQPHHAVARSRHQEEGTTRQQAHRLVRSVVTPASISESPSACRFAQQEADGITGTMTVPAEWAKRVQRFGVNHAHPHVRQIGNCIFEPPSSPMRRLLMSGQLGRGTLGVHIGSARRNRRHMSTICRQPYLAGKQDAIARGMAVAACHGERFGRPSGSDQKDRRMGWLRSIRAAGLLWWSSPQSARQRPSASGFFFCTPIVPIFSPRSCSSPEPRSNALTGPLMVVSHGGFKQWRVLWRTCAVERQRHER